MNTLREQLVEVEAQAALLRRRIGAENCAVAGHDWRFVGGKNAGCSKDCSCSVPVHECTTCRDSDYGDNDYADKQIGRCAQDRALEPQEGRS